MEYVQIDENLPDSPKMLRIPRKQRALCLGLYARALCYCSKHETDGVFPAGLVDDHPSGTSALLAATLFDEVDGGALAVHDYLDYNKSRAEIEAIREARRAAGSKGGQQTASKREAKAKQTQANEYPSTSTSTETTTEGQVHDAREQSPLSQCCDLITGTYGTFPTVKQREKLSLLCERYTNAADRLAFGIAKAKAAGKQNAGFAIGCAESASVQEMERVDDDFWVGERV